MGGAQDSNCRRETEIKFIRPQPSFTESLTQRDLWTHVRSNKPELLYYYKVSVWKLSYMYYTTGIPSTSVCEKDRERERETT